MNVSVLLVLFLPSKQVGVALELYSLSGSTRVEFLPGYKLFWMRFSCFSTVSPGKLRCYVLKQATTSLSKSLPAHHS